MMCGDERFALCEGQWALAGAAGFFLRRQKRCGGNSLSLVYFLLLNSALWAPNLKQDVRSYF